MPLFCLSAKLRLQTPILNPSIKQCRATGCNIPAYICKPLHSAVDFSNRKGTYTTLPKQTKLSGFFFFFSRILFQVDLPPTSFPRTVKICQQNQNQAIYHISIFSVIKYYTHTNKKKNQHLCFKILQVSPLISLLFYKTHIPVYRESK